MVLVPALSLVFTGTIGAEVWNGALVIAMAMSALLAIPIFGIIALAEWSATRYSAPVARNQHIAGVWWFTLGAFLTSVVAASCCMRVGGYVMFAGLIFGYIAAISFSVAVPLTLRRWTASLDHKDRSETQVDPAKL